MGNRSKVHWRHSFALPVIVAFVARLATFPLAHLSSPQYWEYGWIARNMLHGFGYAMNWSGDWTIGPTAPTAFMPPGQVVLIFWPMAFFGDNLVAYVVVFLQGAALGTLFVYVTGRILRLTFQSDRITITGLWLAALYPSFVISATSFGVINAVLALDALFILSVLLLSKRMRKGEGVMNAAIATGVCAGLLTFFRSESLLVSGVTVLVILWVNRESIGKYWKQLSFGIAALLIVVLPWNIRNYTVFHRVIVGSTNGGFNFWRGHNPTATGSSWHMDGRAVWTNDTMMRAMAPKRVIDSNFELTYDAYHMHKAEDWIAEHPTLEAERTLKKGVLFWGVDWYSKESRSLPYIGIYALTLAGFITGIVRIRREKPWASATIRDAVAMIAIWCVLYTLITMAFFSLPRLQILLIGVYFPIVVYGVDFWLTKIGKRRAPAEAEGASTLVDQKSRFQRNDHIIRHTKV